MLTYREDAAGRLTAASLCAAIACLQPERSIIVDESLTSGAAYWDLSKVRHHLNIAYTQYPE